MGLHAAAAIRRRSLSLLTLSLVWWAMPAPAAETTIHVAPNGNDSATGAADRPFATVARARDAVRALKQRAGGKLAEPVTVVLHGGTYFLREPVVFAPQDSGTADCPVTYAAAPGETVVVSGGQRVSGWSRGQLVGHDVWTAKVPGTATFRELWVNGEPRTRARLPNKGYLKIAEVPDAKPNTDWTKGQTNWKYAEGDLKGDEDLGQAEAVVFTRWVDSRLPVQSIDAKDRLLRFTKRSVWKLDPGDVYYLENSPQFLDSPGEWYVDDKADTLYYLPKPGEDMAKAEAVVPRLTQLVRIEGKPNQSQYVEHVRFRGIQFSHSEWPVPPAKRDPTGEPERGGSNQSATQVSAAIYAEGARNCVWEDCAIVNAGNYGLELARGCQNNRVVGCTFRELGGGGVRLGETAMRDDKAEQAFGNEISDCSITWCGRLWASAVGVWVGQSYDNRITHNLIANLGYTGISVGWTWGYGKAINGGNVIESNLVHHIGRREDEDMPALSDMGGIYTLGNQPGTVIRNNVFHDIEGRTYGGWGIYFDEGTRDVVAERNLVYRTTHGAFHQHYGRDNVFRNNVLAYARTRQIERSRSEPHRSYTFEHNVVIWNQGQGIMGNWDNFNVVFDYNIYWPYGNAEKRWAYRDFEQWQKQGMDPHSLVADPLFVDPEKDDFTLKPDSPALKLGFVPPDWSKVGPRPRGERTGS